MVGPFRSEAVAWIEQANALESELAEIDARLRVARSMRADLRRLRRPVIASVLSGASIVVALLGLAIGAWVEMQTDTRWSTSGECDGR